MSRRVVVLPTSSAVAGAAADRVVKAARNAIRRRGRFCVALSGGSTPRATYDLLASPPRIGAVDWSRVEFFWGDERAVPPDHPDSNFGAAKAHLLDHLPGIRPQASHRMPADEPDLDAAAEHYEAEIAHIFGVARGASRPPAFDLIWLGMGADGHTASLFPGSTALDERRRWVVATRAPGIAAWRMTVTQPLINAARAVLFVVTGADKAPALRSIESGSRELPAARILAKSTTFLVDALAAGRGS